MCHFDVHHSQGVLKIRVMESKGGWRDEKWRRGGDKSSDKEKKRRWEKSEAGISSDVECKM